MTLIYHACRLRDKTSSFIFKLINPNKEKFTCPVCGYRGPFKDIAPFTGTRIHAKCPGCNALERHRLQFLVVNNVFNVINTDNLKMLHFAPEPFFREFFSKRFGQYETADLSMNDVDHNVDLQQLPFNNETYDLVFASHVLDYIPNDEKALSEIRRILKPNGIAILPVPVIAGKTIEYSEPNQNIDYKMRSAGIDYIERYEHHFSKVERFRSDSFPPKYQLYIYEDRSQWSTKYSLQLSNSDLSKKHMEIVPVCFV